MPPPTLNSEEPVMNSSSPIVVMVCSVSCFPESVVENVRLAGPGRWSPRRAWR